MMDFTNYMIPESIKNDLKLYYEFGIPVGQFLRATLSGDVFQAITRADEAHQKCFVDIIKFIINEMPCGSYGSRDRVDTWIDEKITETRKERRKAI